MIICEKRQSILEANGHVLVLGGPGSGKSTIALLKARRQIEAGLKPGQSVLFLSFSRAAVSRLAEAATAELGGKKDGIKIQTFHSFYWEILRAHGYLLGAPCKLTLLPPQDERVLSKGIKADKDPNEWESWLKERERLFSEKGLVAFDLFAPKVAELLARSKSVARLFGNRYPLILVDEAQDTADPQWQAVRQLAPFSQLVCLADLDQQIFDFLPGVGPERIQQIQRELAPLVIDFEAENYRSPGTQIAEFGNAILAGYTQGGPYQGVSKLSFSPKDKDVSIRRALGMLNKVLTKELGHVPESIGILASFEKGVAAISVALQNGGRPIPHKVMFDETSTLLSARFLAFLMEPKWPIERTQNIHQALSLIEAVHRAQRSSTAQKRADRLAAWANGLMAGTSLRGSLPKAIGSLIQHIEEMKFTGDPRKDWSHVCDLLQESQDADLMAIKGHLRHTMLFSRGRSIASGLSEVWESSRAYISARKIVDTALSQDQLISGGEHLSGIHVMTMHKSKGKQFDGVIILRADWISPFVWPGDSAPFSKSRKVLRVAATRARVHTLILYQAFPPCPIVGNFAL